jgi:hypothetical protein
MVFLDLAFLCVEISADPQRTRWAVMQFLNGPGGTHLPTLTARQSNHHTQSRASRQSTHAERDALVSRPHRPETFPRRLLGSATVLTLDVPHAPTWFALTLAG